MQIEIIRRSLQQVAASKVDGNTLGGKQWNPIHDITA